jgi:hypothetical protein
MGGPVVVYPEAVTGVSAKATAHSAAPTAKLTPMDPTYRIAELLFIAFIIFISPDERLGPDLLY